MYQSKKAIICDLSITHKKEHKKNEKHKHGQPYYHRNLTIIQFPHHKPYPTLTII